MKQKPQYIYVNKKPSFWCQAGVFRRSFGWTHLRLQGMERTGGAASFHLPRRFMCGKDFPAVRRIDW
jgi:hypothetical protein